jgi:hypothetical protein
MEGVINIAVVVRAKESMYLDNEKVHTNLKVLKYTFANKKYCIHPWR